VVEEDDGVRGVLRESASLLGYHVLSASGAPAAMELAAHHAGAIHLLVAELVSPGLSGRELAHRLRALRPGLRCLFLSGPSGTGPLDTMSAILAKPVRFEALARGLREVLDRGSGEQESHEAAS
jgi:CheY-like chemotaxis protein